MLVGRESLTGPGIDLGLADPMPQPLERDAEVAGDPEMVAPGSRAIGVQLSTCFQAVEQQVEVDHPGVGLRGRRAGAAFQAPHFPGSPRPALRRDPPQWDPTAGTGCLTDAWRLGEADWRKAKSKANGTAPGSVDS